MRLDLYARGTDGRLWWTAVYRSTVAAGALYPVPNLPWSPLGDLQIGSSPVTTSAVDPVTKALLRRSVFVRGADGALCAREWR